MPEKCGICDDQFQSSSNRLLTCGNCYLIVHQGWAHILCALYIPEVYFKDPASMELVMLENIPPERFGRSCVFCERNQRSSQANHGVCIQCAWKSCRTYFHVTCAGSAGLLSKLPSSKAHADNSLANVLLNSVSLCASRNEQMHNSSDGANMATEARDALPVMDKTITIMLRGFCSTRHKEKFSTSNVSHPLEEIEPSCSDSTNSLASRASAHTPNHPRHSSTSTPSPNPPSSFSVTPDGCNDVVESSSGPGPSENDGSTTNSVIATDSTIVANANATPLKQEGSDALHSTRVGEKVDDYNDRVSVQPMNGDIPLSNRLVELGVKRTRELLIDESKLLEEPVVKQRTSVVQSLVIDVNDRCRTEMNQNQSIKSALTITNMSPTSVCTPLAQHHTVPTSVAAPSTLITHRRVVQPTVPPSHMIPGTEKAMMHTPNVSPPINTVVVKRNTTPKQQPLLMKTREPFKASESGRKPRDTKTTRGNRRANRPVRPKCGPLPKSECLSPSKIKAHTNLPLIWPRRPLALRGTSLPVDPLMPCGRVENGSHCCRPTAPPGVSSEGNTASPHTPSNLTAPTTTTTDSLKSFAQSPLTTMQDLLEWQWDQAGAMLMQQAQGTDVVSLLDCLHQLKSENDSLEAKLVRLKTRHEHLRSVHAKLSASLTTMEAANTPTTHQHSMTTTATAAVTVPVSVPTGTPTTPSPILPGDNCPRIALQEPRQTVQQTAIKLATGQFSPVAVGSILSTVGTSPSLLPSQTSVCPKPNQLDTDQAHGGGNGGGLLTYQNQSSSSTAPIMATPITTLSPHVVTIPSVQPISHHQGCHSSASATITPFIVSDPTRQTLPLPTLETGATVSTLGHTRPSSNSSMTTACPLPIKHNQPKQQQQHRQNHHHHHHHHQRKENPAPPSPHPNNRESGKSAGVRLWPIAPAPEETMSTIAPVAGETDAVGIERRKSVDLEDLREISARLSYAIAARRPLNPTDSIGSLSDGNSHHPSTLAIQPELLPAITTGAPRRPSLPTSHGGTNTRGGDGGGGQTGRKTQSRKGRQMTEPSSAPVPILASGGHPAMANYTTYANSSSNQPVFEFAGAESRTESFNYHLDNQCHSALSQHPIHQISAVSHLMPSSVTMATPSQGHSHTPLAPKPTLPSLFGPRPTESSIATSVGGAGTQTLPAASTLLDNPIVTR